MERGAYVKEAGKIVTHVTGDGTIEELAEMAAHEHANKSDWKVGDEMSFEVVVEDDEMQAEYKIQATVVCDLNVSLSRLRGGDNG